MDCVLERCLFKDNREFVCGAEFDWTKLVQSDTVELVNRDKGDSDAPEDEILCLHILKPDWLAVVDEGSKILDRAWLNGLR